MTNVERVSADREIQHIIVPGRHHLLTRFQAAYLGELLAGRGRDENGEPIAVADGAVVVWAVTSANHSATRRNPFPGHRREAAIEILAHVERMPSIVVPVVDIAPTPRFAEITLKEIGYATAQGVIPAPETAIIATSTPQVADMYRGLGYRIAPMERDHSDAPRTPWQLLDELMAGSDDWRADAHPASLDIVDRYGLATQAQEIAADPVIGDEGGLTPTRDYRTYSRAFEDAAERKWAQARPWIVPGRIVDLGCATGAMLELASQEPALAESDLIGVEIAPELFAACEHKKSEGAFANPNTFFYRRNILAGTPLPRAQHRHDPQLRADARDLLLRRRDAVASGLRVGDRRPHRSRRRVDQLRCLRTGRSRSHRAAADAGRRRHDARARAVGLER